MEPFLILYTDPALWTTSFYLNLSINSYGHWLACGSIANGNCFLFDVGNATHRSSKQEGAMKLQAEGEEIGATDWSSQHLVTCSDSGMVHLW